jgi:bifunctional non-homologous end joining protein LigD
MAKAAREQTVTVDGRLVKISNLDKVLYPETGTTKADVLGYYAEVGPTMLPHLYERPVTRKRWPDGVAAGPGGKAPIVFFAKDLGAGTPDWVVRRKIAHRDHDNYYPVVNDLATLAWLAQLAALEIHVPQWRFSPEGQPRNPDRLVLDLDPGPGVSLTDCAAIALLARDILRDIGHDPVAVTSGSKGVHLYAPLDGSQSPEQATAVARELARALEADHRDRVISSMKRSERDGKVFLDWSQNNGNKTTISPYSLRGRDHPMVAAPRT